MAQTPPLAPQYVADVSPVTEVSLWGTAALDYWQERLAPYALHCTEQSGRARLMISAAAARFKGIAFRELSLSVAVCRERGGTSVDGFFLLHAFNSVRFFAFIERTLFSTPYHFARVNVTAEPRPQVAVQIKREAICTAEMAHTINGVARAPERTEPASWEGPIFLPGKEGSQSERRLFFARLEGETDYYPFDSTSDTLWFTANPAATVLESLLDSQFTPEQWLIRRRARHAKSKTVRRIRALGFD